MARLPTQDGEYAILFHASSGLSFSCIDWKLRQSRKGRYISMTTTPSLSTIINGVNVENLFATIDSIKASPAIAKFKFRIENQWQEAGRNTTIVNTFYGAGHELSRAKHFVLKADEPAILLGADTAANPVEYLLHALAACLTTSMVYHAAARDIQIDEVESSLEGDLDLRGFLELDRNTRQGYQGIRVTFKVKANVPDEQLQELVELGTGHSPVFDSLTNGVPISVKAARL